MEKEWDSVELLRLFDRICCGYTVVTYRGITYTIKDPTIKERQITQPHYDKVYDTLLRAGVPSQSDILILLEDRGIWDEFKDREMERLQKSLKDAYEDMATYEFQSNKKKVVKQKIEYIQTQLKTLNKQKNSLNHLTAEHIANSARYKKYLFMLTEPGWDSWEDFQAEEETVCTTLLSAAYFSDEINEPSIRKLARSEPWRSVWLCGVKTGGQLFDRPHMAMTDYQRMLISWSLIYDSVFEHPESPSADIIDNDELLDIWLQQQHQKRKSGSQDSVTKNISKNPKIQNAKEVGIVVDSVEDAEKVYNLNDASAKAVLRSRDKTVEDKGHIQEFQLPDVQQENKMKRNNMAAQAIKNRK